MLEQCAVQIDEMQGAADRRAPEADDPAAGRRSLGAPKKLPVFWGGALQGNAADWLSPQAAFSITC
jgi:hypothetical protein